MKANVADRNSGLGLFMRISLGFLPRFDFRPRRRAPQVRRRADYLSRVSNSPYLRGWRKSVLSLGTFLDYERAVKASEDNAQLARTRSVVPFHNVAF